MLGSIFIWIVCGNSGPTYQNKSHCLPPLQVSFMVSLMSENRSFSAVLIPVLNLAWGPLVSPFKLYLGFPIPSAFPHLHSSNPHYLTPIHSTHFHTTPSYFFFKLPNAPWSDFLKRIPSSCYIFSLNRW